MASLGSECPSGTRGPRRSCRPQSRKLRVCYANVRRFTEPPQFLEECTLGIFAFGLGRMNLTRCLALGGCHQDPVLVFASDPKCSRKAAVPQVPLSLCLNSCL